MQRKYIPVAFSHIYLSHFFIRYYVFISLSLYIIINVKKRNSINRTFYFLWYLTRSYYGHKSMYKVLFYMFFQVVKLQTIEILFLLLFKICLYWRFRFKSIFLLCRKIFFHLYNLFTHTFYDYVDRFRNFGNEIYDGSIYDIWKAVWKIIQNKHILLTNIYNYNHGMLSLA